MTLTPEQLDAIATKLLGWKPNTDDPGAALLVLEAMGDYTTLDGISEGEWLCRHLTDAGKPAIDSGFHKTPAAAIFACAAKLVERM